MNKQCEKCGKTEIYTESRSDCFDYCAICSRNLCDECMAEGCCGRIPAQSGMAADYADD